MRTAPLLLMTLALAAAPAAQAAKPGTFSGSLGLSVPKGAQAEVRAVSRADGSVQRVRTASKTGAFSLSLPAGQYLVIGSVLPKGGRGKVLKQTQVAVSLKAGQKRTRAKLNARKKKKRKAKRRLAQAAYVQEKGQVTAGSVAIEIPPFTGATGELSVMNKGMAAMLITDMFGPGGAADECDVVVVEVEHRDDILKELELQKSPYFDQSSRVERNFVIGDVEVKGTLKTGAGGKTLDYDVRLIDKKSGGEVGKLTGTMDAEDLFKAEQELAKQLNEELCKLSDTYEVTIDITGAGNFATHSAGGTLKATIKAKRAGKKDRVWRGDGVLGWSGTSYASKLPDCTYIDPLEPTAPWSVTLTATGDGQLQVAWTHETGDAGTASVRCPQSPPRPPAIVPGQPGPSLIMTTPEQFTLPVAGGVQPLTGGFSEGGDGWFNSGTLTIRPGGVARMG